MKVTLPNGIVVEVEPGESVAVDGVEIDNWTGVEDSEPEPEPPPEKSLRAVRERLGKPQPEDRAEQEEVDPVEAMLTPKMRKTLEAMRKYPDGVHLDQLGKDLKIEQTIVGTRVRRMIEQGVLIERVSRGVYRAP